MNEFKAVLNRLNLSSDKIELASIKDLDEFYNKSKDSFDKAKKQTSVIERLYDEKKELESKEEKLETELEKLSKELNSVSMTWGNELSSIKASRGVISNRLKEYSKALNDVERKVKDLGLDVNLKKHQDALNDLSRALKLLEEWR